MIDEVYSAENDVIMDMSLVDMGCQDVFVLPLCDGIGKLPSDLMGFLITDLSRLKGLDQMVGYIIALIKRL